MSLYFTGVLLPVLSRDERQEERLSGHAGGANRGGGQSGRDMRGQKGLNICQEWKSRQRLREARGRP